MEDAEDPEDVIKIKKNPFFHCKTRRRQEVEATRKENSAAILCLLH